MPLGWYLAQGLIPLGPSSSDEDEGPCELPDGRLVCGPHGLVTCGKCCMDFSFMEEVLSDRDDDDAASWNTDEDDLDFESEQEASDPSNAEIRNMPPFGREMKRGTGLVFPHRFSAPTASTQPLELFKRTTGPFQPRYERTTNAGNRQVLLFTDGACVNNGQANPKAGWAFVSGSSQGTSGLAAISGRLEKRGPFGDPAIQSSNRAELRAVIAALRFRYWKGEGYSGIVVATDSEYVVAGCTSWAKSWVRNGWKTNGNADVKNKDLWEMLLGEVERWHDDGVSVQFWRIPRSLNTVADAAAKTAAIKDDVSDDWQDVVGIMHLGPQSPLQMA